MAGLPEKRKKEKNPAVHFWELNFARTYGITAYDGENEMQIKKNETCMWCDFRILGMKMVLMSLRK